MCLYVYIYIYVPFKNLVHDFWSGVSDLVVCFGLGKFRKLRNKKLKNLRIKNLGIYYNLQCHFFFLMPQLILITKCKLIPVPKCKLNVVPKCKLIPNFLDAPRSKSL